MLESDISILKQVLKDVSDKDIKHKIKFVITELERKNKDIDFDFNDPNLNWSDEKLINRLSLHIMDNSYDTLVALG